MLTDASTEATSVAHFGAYLYAAIVIDIVLCRARARALLIVGSTAIIQVR